MKDGCDQSVAVALPFLGSADNFSNTNIYALQELVGFVPDSVAGSLHELNSTQATEWATKVTVTVGGDSGEVSSTECAASRGTSP